MKTKLNKLFIVLFIPVIYFLFFTGFKETLNPVAGSKAMVLDPLPKDFVNFILNPAYGNYASPWDMENFLTEYGGELNFTGVHIYDEADGNMRLGTFNEPLSEGQIDYVNGLIDSSYGNGLKPVFERTKISRLCYGQRLEYEVSNGGSTTLNYGFCYRNCMSNTYGIDAGRTVLHATTGVNQPGRLCDSIYENLQHTDLYWFRPQQGDLDNWYIKPMLKIKESDFSPDDTTKVAAIVTHNLIGKRIDSTIIKVRNFRNLDNEYYGTYIDVFNFQGEFPAVDLEIPGRIAENELNEGNYPGYYNQKECKVDFKVYWFGNVDVWLDKMTVDDEIANDLLRFDRTGNYDEKIIDMATPENFVFVTEIVKQKQFTYANTEPINHVLNIMYNKLKNQARLITGN